MDRTLLVRLLKNSQYQSFLKVDPYGVQLPSFIATVCSIKPAMDLWIKPTAWQAFQECVNYFGLHYYLDTYFNRHAETDLLDIPNRCLTTTRAAWSASFDQSTEAHVFVAKERSNLDAVVSSGWYPLVVHDYFVEKHLADHAKFGQALGYPLCCQRFFHHRNNWHIDNTYYAAYRCTHGDPRILSNGLLRHTAFSLVSHLPCSFLCNATIEYATILRALITETAPDYVKEIDRHLASPVLCLSELQIYRFEGTLSSLGQVHYSSIAPVNPTDSNSLLCQLLKKGDTCIVDGNLIRIYKNGVQVEAYMARADRHGPEFPFIVQCN